MNLPHQHTQGANANPPAAGVSTALIGAFYSHSFTPRSSSACKRAKSALTAADAHSCAARDLLSSSMQQSSFFLAKTTRHDGTNYLIGPDPCS